MTPGEMAAVKQASKFFAKYFGIPLIIVGFLVLVGIWLEPISPPPIKEFIYVPDTAQPWKREPYIIKKPRKRTEKEILEEIESNTSKNRY